MSIFDYEDYKRLIGDRISSNREVRGYQGKLATAAGCQPSFLSQVLRSKVHLTSEHLLGIARYWNLSDLETDYLLALLQYARAGTAALSAWTKRKLEAIRRESEDLRTRFAQSAEVESAAELYYSSWEYSAVHIAVAIPKYRTVSAVAAALGMQKRRAKRILTDLERFGLVEFSANEWKILKPFVHLSSDSKWVATHHSSWRGKMISRLGEADPSHLHFTGVWAVSHEDAKRIRQTLVLALDTAGKIARDSPEVQLCAVGLDFLPIVD